MGTETYPKGKERRLGEQKSCTYATAHENTPKEYHQAGSATSYPARGHAGPASRHKSHEKPRGPFATGTRGGLRSETYPDSTHGNFPSEQAKNVLQSPTSGKPKAA